MPPPKKLHANFEESNFYHVICKSIEGKDLCPSEENKRFFLQRYLDYSQGFVDTYAYCLLDNHVHFLIKTRSTQDILLQLKTMESNRLTSTFRRFVEGTCQFHELIEQQFNRFLISYSLSLHKMNGSSGPILSRPFKRIEVKDNAHLTQLFIYIHANAQKHGIVKDFTKFKWSSYHALISDRQTNLKRAEALEWFGGMDRYIATHRELAEFYYDHPLGGE